ncbi:uncharacterized protein PAE49_021865 [Odontesthes bonariensis]
MQRTLQLSVALLNIVWIAFFLTPDPFSVLVQRRSSQSSGEEVLFGEFCIDTTFPEKGNLTPNEKFNSIGKINSSASPEHEPNLTDLGEPTPPTQRPTTSGVTSVSELIPSSSSQAALITLSQDSKVPDKPREDYERPLECCLSISKRRIPTSIIVGYRRTYGCPIKAVVLITRKHRIMCFPLNDEWVRRIIQRLPRHEHF